MSKMKYLFMMRHAKSSWKNPSLADHERPLNSRGKTDAPKMGHFISSTGKIPGIILCSTAKRARQTVDYFLQECPFDGEVIYRQNLYHGGLEDYWDEIQLLDDAIESAFIVGHNPGLEYAIEDLCGKYEIMPTSAIALIKLDISSWKDLNLETSGELVSVFRPKEI